MNIEQKKIAFIGGLHRSGTSILSNIISSSSKVTGFCNTRVPENEGQHLQTVFQLAHFHGEPGKFAFDINAQLNEDSTLITVFNKDKLIKEWGRYWNLTKNVLLEKSPPNIIRTGFLQRLFPNSHFINIIRNLVAVSIATQKWFRTTLDNLISHWLKAHEILQNDRRFLNNYILLSYENLIENPLNVLDEIEKFLDIKIDYKDQLEDRNKVYFEK